MSFVTRRGLLDIVSVFVQAKRFRGKINVQKPRKPHFERALLFQAANPYYIKDESAKAKDLLCGHALGRVNKEVNGTNKLQVIYAKELLDKFKSSKLIAIYHKNPLSAEVEFNAYAAFHKINMDYKVYSKSTLELAIKDTPYQGILGMYVSQNALVFSKDPDIKKLLKVNKKFPQLIFLAAIYENNFLSKDDVVKLSSVGNIQTARAELVQTINCHSQQLVQLLDVNQQNLVSLLERRSDQLNKKSTDQK